MKKNNIELGKLINEKKIGLEFYKLLISMIKGSDQDQEGDQYNYKSG